MDINQLKLEVHDSYGKDEKIITNFKTVNNEVVINKAYSDEKLFKKDGHASLSEKNTKNWNYLVTNNLKNWFWFRGLS